jgi:hypothetical protein
VAEPRPVAATLTVTEPRRAVVVTPVVVVQLPVFQLPAFQLPVFQLPVFQLPVFQLPVFQLPVFQLPVFQGPAFQRCQRNAFATPTSSSYVEKRVAMSSPVKLPTQPLGSWKKRMAQKPGLVPMSNQCVIPAGNPSRSPA